MKRPERKKRGTFSLTFYISLLVFLAQIATILLLSFMIGLLGLLDIFEINANIEIGWGIFPLILVGSTIVGIVITTLIGRGRLKPLRSYVNAMNRLASGDFSVRLNTESAWSRIPGLSELYESFNKTAEELSKTEMLRSDFVNNFSHEFKTPIVSISGFAKLLRYGNLSAEQEKEYLGIIQEESMRLAQMATNVLSLTKVENQEILTDISRFNVSEQIRNCILLLEEKWEKKDLVLDLEFDEYYIEAAEDLLMQVWINLLDNAFKFCQQGGTVTVGIERADGNITVKISNTGSEIPKWKQELVFRKFYQADESHSQQGNGVGLAIVKRVADLHGGKVFVDSDSMTTCFTTVLPERQTWNFSAV